LGIGVSRRVKRPVRVGMLPMFAALKK